MSFLYTPLVKNWEILIKFFSLYSLSSLSMFSFFSKATEELEHVVWPTPKETKKYMYYTIAVIIIMAVALQIVGFSLQSTLSALRQQFPQKEYTTDLTGTGDTSSIIEQLDQSIQAGSEENPSISGEVSESGVIQVTPIQ